MLKSIQIFLSIFYYENCHQNELQAIYTVHILYIYYIVAFSDLYLNNLKKTAILRSS
jgi:hypothetical protein